MVLQLIRKSRRGFQRLAFYGSFGNVNSLPQLNRYNLKYSTICAKLDKLSPKVSSRSSLLASLERALKEHQVDKALESYKDFKRLYGFPDQSLVANLITGLSYSSDSKCLRTACDLVLSISREKPALLRHEVMTKVALSLARAQIPVPASNVVRLMLDKRSLPSLDVLRMVFLHLVKTEVGTYLASNILEEICYCFQKLSMNKSAQTELTKTDATIFNLVLDACVKFGSTLRAQQIVELMPQLGVVADAHTVAIIARVHEMNGMRDELKKFKDYVDMVPVNLACHYQQFYDCLLSLHFKFNDIDGVAELLVDLSRYFQSNPLQKGQRDQQKSCIVPIGSENIKMGLKLHFLPQQLSRDSIYKVDNKPELVLFKNGKFVLSNKGLAKLIILYKRHGKISGLAKLLISIQNMLYSSENSSPCSDVVDTCIYLGWLEAAHDILEDLESEKYCVRESSYASLLTAYHDKKMFREAEGLVTQMRRIGITTNSSDKLASTRKSDLSDAVVQNIREEEKEVSYLVHEYNSSIYFFTKAKMIGDAVLAYRKMQKLKIQPNTSTFFHLVGGYSSMELYREITILWGDIKRSMENQRTVYHRDLYELLLLNFIRGGYFERVMEVVGFMMENNMYLDKWSYKTEFLKFHRDLYRKLTAVDAKDETQSRRIEHVKAFRKLVGIG